MIGGVGEFDVEVDLLVPAFFKIEIGPVFLRFWFRLLVIITGDGEGQGEGEREGEREEEREGRSRGGGMERILLVSQKLLLVGSLYLEY